MMENSNKKMMMGTVKMEDYAVGSSSCSYSSSSSSSSFMNPLLSSSNNRSVFDFSGEFGSGEKGSNLGFMELLGVQDYYSTSITTSSLDHFHSPQLLSLPHSNNNCSDNIKGHPPEAATKECSQVLNHQHQHHQHRQPPATPNSSSISSASSEALHDEHTKTVDQQPPHHHDVEEHKNTNKLLKAKKTNLQKRQKEPRFAFMTKSEVDHLEDGYRWRKYGQKAVKNSPFPRSYYRCTAASCNVKKRVERSLNDPSVVVTTYEGQHTHPSPVMSRSSGFAGSPIPAGIATAGLGAFGSIMPENYLSQYYQQRQQQHQQQQLLFNTLSSLGFPSKNIVSQDRQLCNQGANGFLTDNGLLQDVVPSHMLKEE